MPAGEMVSGMGLKCVKGRLYVARATTMPSIKSADSWRGSKSSAERGYGSRWRKARVLFLLRHPLCVYCQAKGVTTPATVVDHITPHRGDMELFWDEHNWQSLCAHCHNSDKQREERQAQSKAGVG